MKTSIVRRAHRQRPSASCVGGEVSDYTTKKREPAAFRRPLNRLHDDGKGDDGQCQQSKRRRVYTAAAAGKRDCGCCARVSLYHRPAAKCDKRRRRRRGDGAHPPLSAKRDLAAADDEIYGPRRYIVVVGTPVKYARGSQSVTSRRRSPPGGLYVKRPPRLDARCLSSILLGTSASRFDHCISVGPCEFIHDFRAIVADW